MTWSQESAWILLAAPERSITPGRDAEPGLSHSTCSGAGVQGLGSPPLQLARGWALVALEEEERAAKAVLPALGVEMHGLTFGFLLSFFQKGSFDVCSACQMMVCKKSTWKHRGGKEKHVPAQDLGKPDFLNCCQLLEKQRA